MNRIFILLLSLIASTAHVSAQTSADTLRAGAVAPGDSLIAVDEQALVRRLALLLNERRAQNQHNRETADLLRTQLLFQLLDGRSAVAPPVAPAPTQASAFGSSDLYQWQLDRINARLSALEQRTFATSTTTTDQTTLETLLRNQQELERQLSGKSRTTVVPAPIPLPLGSSGASDSRVSELETRIAALEQQRNALVAQRDTLVRNLMAQRMHAQGAPTTGVTVSTMPAPALSQGTAVVSEQIVQVPGDFRRTIYFRVSSAVISAAGTAQLRETAEFLKRYPTAQVSVVGYASPDGRLAYNKRLAARRLQAVVGRLHQLGVPASRIVYTQSGIASPTISNDFGRRVEITLAP